MVRIGGEMTILALECVRHVLSRPSLKCFQRCRCSEYKPPRRKRNTFVSFYSEMRPKIVRDHPGLSSAGQVLTIAGEMYRQMSEGQLADLKMRYDEEDRQRLETWHSLDEETRSTIEMELQEGKELKQTRHKDREWRNKNLTDVGATGHPKPPAPVYMRFIQSDPVEGLTNSISMKEKCKTVLDAYRKLPQADRQKIYEEFRKDWKAYQTQRKEWMQRICDEKNFHLLNLNRKGKPYPSLPRQARLAIESLEDQSIINKAVQQIGDHNILNTEKKQSNKS